ncbi:MAG: class II fructose-bisphosphate aldolase, partial [Synergistaceae bacterium]|nr:class II fructose-bisphosphate aldolase [Synergistaceae bacterium]
PFHEKVLAEPPQIVGRIVDEIADWGRRFIKAFGAEGTAEKVREVASRRVDHNSSPERVIRSPRVKYGPGAAPNKAKGADGSFDD